MQFAQSILAYDRAAVQKPVWRRTVDGNSERTPEHSPLTRFSVSVGSVLCEQHDEWRVSKLYFSAGSLAKLDRREEQRAEQPQLVAG
jgi:hypothetical protein